MKKGTLDNGFEYEIDETLLDDMEFLDLFADTVNGDDPWAIFKVIKTMFPPEKKKELYQFCRNRETGRVPPTKVGELIGAIIEDVRKDGKNS